MMPFGIINKRKAKERDTGEKISYISRLSGKFFGFIKDSLYNLSVKLYSLFHPSGRRMRITSMSKRKRNEIIFLFFLLIYPITHFLIFYVGINLNSILLSFKKYNLDSGVYSWVGLEYIIKLIDDMATDIIMLRALKNSLIVYSVSLFIGLPLNLVFAYIIYKKLPLASFFQIILFLPSILSNIVISIMFRQFIDNGIPELLMKLNINREINLLFDPDTAFGMQIFFCLWSGFGPVLIIYYSSMSRISDSLIEYGQLEGITLFKEFVYVVLPMIFSTITIYLVTGIAGIFTNALALYNFYGDTAPSELNTLGYYFFVKVIGRSATLADYPYASAGGVVFTLIAAPITLLVKYLLEKFGPNVEY